MSVEEEAIPLCEEWISLWIDTALGFNMVFPALSFYGGVLLFRKVPKSSAAKDTLLRWIALTTILQAPFQCAGSGHLLLFSSKQDGWTRCDLSTWPKVSFIPIFFFEFFRTASNGYVLLLGGFIVFNLHRWKTKSSRNAGEPMNLNRTLLFHDTKAMHLMWHSIPWFCAGGNSCTLILWNWFGGSITDFYSYSLVFNCVTTFFSVWVCMYTLCFYHNFWSSSNSKDFMPSAVKKTLQLMVRFIIADVTCNFGWTLLSLWTTKDGGPNTVLFHLAIPLMSAQGFANYFVYVVDKNPSAPSAVAPLTPVLQA